MWRGDGVTVRPEGMRFWAMERDLGELEEDCVLGGGGLHS